MRSPECPRCGYDLSGKLEGYRESCPLEDVCSECGCDFAWRNVLGDAACPRWFVEHPERAAWRTMLPTLARLAVPGRFWHRVMMEHQPRWRRALLVVLVVYVGCGAVTGGVLAFEAWQASTLRAAQVARAQGRPQGGVITFKNYMPGWQVTADAVAARVGGGVLFPLTLRWFETDYYANATWRWRRTPPPWYVHLGMTPSVFAAVPVFTLLATTVMFVVPMQTRSIYRVRSWHVARIAIYGLAGAIAIGFGLNVVAAAVVGYVSGWQYRFVHHVLPWLPILISGGWALLWWSAATRHYLRIEAWQGFAWPLVGVGVLAGLTGQILYAFALFPGSDALYYIPGGNLF